MTGNSLLCNYISLHPDDFPEALAREYRIKVKRDGSLAIFNYSFDCDFSLDIVKEARGIIIDTDELSVVCRPFTKFGNYSEYYADDIDWSSARVQEKVDGSIIKLWYNKKEAKWQFSTNGMIRAEEAHIEGFTGESYLTAIKSAENFSDIKYDTLDKGKTYIFELVSTMTRVIIDYKKNMLYHIGTRYNESGLELEEDIGIIKPRSYPLTSLKECIDAAIALNNGAGDNIEAEGFVVVDKNYHRIKIKSPDYIVTHKLKVNTIPTRREFLEIILERPNDIQTMIAFTPSLKHIFAYYEYKLEELKFHAVRLCEMSKALLSEYSGDRGAVARVIKEHRLSFVAFTYLSRGGDPKEILTSLGAERLSKLIDSYEDNDDISPLFS